jgi:hypothetical protein
MFEQELAFVKNHWWSSGRPTMVVMLTERMMKSTPRYRDKEKNFWRDHANSNSRRNLLNFMMSLRSGMCNNVRVRVGKLADMINMSCIESLDFLVDRRSAKSAEHWDTILCGDRPHDFKDKLQLSEEETSIVTESADTSFKRTGSLSRGRSIRRRSADFGGSSKSKSPLKSPYYSDDPKYDTFRLLEHIDGDGSDQRLSSSPIRYVDRTSSPLRGGTSNRLMKGPVSGSNASVQSDSKSRRDSYTFDVKDSLSLEAASKGGSNSSIHATMKKDAVFSVTPDISMSNSIPTSVDDTDSESVMETITVTLKDPSNVDKALALLRTSANLYDQMDLLHCNIFYLERLWA